MMSVINEVSFELEQRENTFTKHGKEWCLVAYLPDDYRWTLYAWDRLSKPKTSEVADVMFLILRAFDFYHKHMHVPPFKLKAYYNNKQIFGG